MIKTTKRRNWTREETIVALNVYCKIPFKTSSKTNPVIIKYAKIIGRSPSALNMKIGNLGRLDPELKAQDISGLSNGSKMDKQVWQEFQDNWSALSYESERIIAKLSDTTVAEQNNIAYDYLKNLPEGKYREAYVKQRVNQNFFRSSILSIYNGKCCMTGMAIADLLVASHIVPWAENEKNRTNPSNGLCLNTLHDKAFDKGFITVTADYRIKLSEAIKKDANNKAVKEYFLPFENKKIILPDKFLPNRDFLEYHGKNIFKH